MQRTADTPRRSVVLLNSDEERALNDDIPRPSAKSQIPRKRRTPAPKKTRHPIEAANETAAHEDALGVSPITKAAQRTAKVRSRIRSSIKKTKRVANATSIIATSIVNARETNFNLNTLIATFHRVSKHVTNLHSKKEAREGSRSVSGDGLVRLTLSTIDQMKKLVDELDGHLEGCVEHLSRVHELLNESAENNKKLHEASHAATLELLNQICYTAAAGQNLWKRASIVFPARSMGESAQQLNEGSPFIGTVPYTKSTKRGSLT